MRDYFVRWMIIRISPHLILRGRFPSTSAWKSSWFVMITGVSVIRPAPLIASTSKVISFWPTTTLSPCSYVLQILSVKANSIHTDVYQHFNTFLRNNAYCMLIWEEYCHCTITGETNSPWFGSITRPYPITPDENTGSVAWLSNLTWPASGLITSVVSVKQLVLPNLLKLL